MPMRFLSWFNTLCLGRGGHALTNDGNHQLAAIDAFVNLEDTAQLYCAGPLTGHAPRPEDSASTLARCNSRTATTRTFSTRDKAVVQSSDYRQEAATDRECLMLAVTIASPPSSLLACSIASVRGTSSGDCIDSDDVVLGRLLGSGSFGHVYKGTWRSRSVAVKEIENRTAATTAQWLQVEVRLQVEVLLAMVLRHPNIVRCYHISTPAVTGNSHTSFTKYFNVLDQPLTEKTRRSLSLPGRVVKPTPPRSKSFSTPSHRGMALLFPTSTAAGLLGAESATVLSSASSEHPTKLIMEYCNEGSLADALVGRRFFTMDSLVPDMRAVLLHAKDVAAGMRYLHSCNVCHGDLKCENVLLQSDPTFANGFVAKVADFGLSGILDGERSHLSKRFNCGTISHTAPEVLLAGRLCQASDVYSFGIILWEMVTAQRPFAGLSDGQIVGRVCRGERPDFPAHIPQPYVDLAERCWVEQPADRPTFDGVLVQLRKLLAEADELQQQCEQPLKELRAWMANMF